MIKSKSIILILIAFLLAACALFSPSAQSIQTAVAQTQAVWTRVPTQSPYPTQTVQPTIVITRVMIWTPVQANQDSVCKPLTNMDYSDNSKVAVLLQAYVSTLPDVKSISYVIPEKLYSNTKSELFHVTYVDARDGKPYSHRYIVYMDEFGWKNAVFSIDGQCWIDPPK